VIVASIGTSDPWNAAGLGLDVLALAESTGSYTAGARAAVYDPVLSASGGGDFADPAFERAMLERFVPHVRLLTPNLDEAARLTGMPAIESVDAMEAAGRALCVAGAHAVLVKGGHLVGAAVDVLVVGDATTVFESSRLPGTLRGTGCLLACAVAARLARGDPLEEAVAFGRAFVREKFATARRAGGMNLAY
jgi:hydroxymethylpyrimidine/phosphomethylpyrimidine kinase